MLIRNLLIAASLAAFMQGAFAEPVCKVVDGDTFHFCNGMKVRLDGIDAPDHGEPFYWNARRALAILLQGNIQTVNCHTDTIGKRQC